MCVLFKFYIISNQQLILKTGDQTELPSSNTPAFKKSVYLYLVQKL